ncbi:MAG: hypothetical protein ACXWC1_25400, partial [Burkholderiales bacterium]
MDPVSECEPETPDFYRTRDVDRAAARAAFTNEHGDQADVRPPQLLMRFLARGRFRTCDRAHIAGQLTPFF